MNIAYNMDCIEAMREMPDKAFDLAIVDPPYGSAGAEEWDDKVRGRFGGRFVKYKIERTGGAWAEKYGKRIETWDVAPSAEYFDELFRVSKNQIIWGGNYFNEHLPSNRNFIVWRKLTISETFTMAMAEYAWTSISGNAKVFECAPQGTATEQRFHPTQKPVKLYEWLLANYAKPGDKILDTHLGSGSSRIAAYNLGFDFTGYEIDKEYFDAEEKRFEAHTAQQSIFTQREAVYEQQQIII